MENENGNVIRNTLDRIGHPATLKEITEHIAEKTQLPAKKVVPTVKKTLQGGVELGYLQYRNGQYYNAIETDDGFCFDVPPVEKTPKAEKARTTRGTAERPPKGKAKAVRRKNITKPRACARRTKPLPRVLVRKNNCRLPAPKQGNRAPGRRTPVKQRPRAPARRPAAKQGTEDPWHMTTMMRGLRKPAPKTRTTVNNKCKPGVRGRKVEARGRPYKANMRGNRSKR